MAASLENYASLLRKTGHSGEATMIEAHAKAIRAKHARESPTYRPSSGGLPFADILRTQKRRLKKPPLKPLDLIVPKGRFELQT